MALTQVSGGGVKDGSIHNADINASASIAGSKVSPDFDSQNVTTTGTVTGASLIPSGSTVPSNGIYLPAANSVAISTDGVETLTASASGIVGQNIFFSNRYAAVPSFVGRRAQGTQSSPTVISVGGTICGLFNASGYDGSAYQSIGGIRFYTDGAISNTSSPGYITFSTTPSESTSNTERLRIASTGAIGLSGANYGTSGQALISQGPSSPPQWGNAGLSPYTITITSTSKTLVNRERCTVTASGQTITLPATPTAGDEVTITIAGTFTDTIIARNGSNVMSLAENMTIDKGDVTITLYYVDATRGWRII